MGAGVQDKKFTTLLIAMVAVPVGMFLKSVWDDAKEQAEEAANPHVRWFDKNRWED